MLAGSAATRHISSIPMTQVTDTLWACTGKGHAPGAYSLWPAWSSPISRCSWATLAWASSSSVLGPSKTCALPLFCSGCRWVQLLRLDVQDVRCAHLYMSCHASTWQFIPRWPSRVGHAHYGKACSTTFARFTYRRHTGGCAKTTLLMSCASVQ